MTIEHLAWDSAFFKRKIGRINTAAALSESDISHLASADCDSIYIFSTARQTVLESSGLLLADEKVTLSKSPDQVPEDPDFFSPSQPSPELHEIFMSSGNYSRFKTDPVFRPYFEKLYTLWMQNALNRTFADHFLCTGTPAKPTGLITLQKRDTALHISIIAVAEHAKGMGLGRRLIQKAESIAHHTLTVDTQGTNLPALAFYQKMGFSMLNRVFVYHWHRD